MVKNYLITAINNLLKNKLYSAINIIGLAIGLSAFILLTLYVLDELSYDKQWDDAECIYRISTVMNLGTPMEFKMQGAPSMVPSAFKDFFPENIKFGTSIKKIPGELQIGDIRYPGPLSRVDQDFINIFQCELLFGNLQSTFKSPNNIALDEELAKKCYGDKNPTGEMITFISNSGDKIEYKVSAVYRFKSSNTVLSVSCFSLKDNAGEGELSWQFSADGTYIRLKEAADIERINKRLPDFIDQKVPHGKLPTGKKLSDLLSFPLQKMSDMYFDPLISPVEQQTKSGNRAVINIFMMISALVLIIACINFIILTTANATQRAREVAMRKVVGARFGQLFCQFIGESVLITLAAALLSIALLETSLPLSEMIMDKNLVVPYSSPGSYLFMTLLVIIVGLLGGIYPAFVLSGFSPSRALSANKTIRAEGSLMFRNILVVFQFAISIALIIATAIAYFQLRYTSKHDPGFNPENLLVLEEIGRASDTKNYANTLQQEFLKLPAVNNVGLSTSQPTKKGGIIYILPPFRPKTDDSTQGQEVTFNVISIDYNFFKTYEMSLLSGRPFIHGLDQEESRIYNPDSDTSNENKGQKRILINNTAARQLGYASPEEAIGKILECGEPGSREYEEFTIIGVVADSQYESLRKKPVPEAYNLSTDQTQFVTIRYHGDYQTIVDVAKNVWQKVVGDIPFNYSSVKLNLAASFSQEEKENRALISFASLAVFIACMGLFGMASFTVDRRSKEIGLRKVMGATVKDIVILLGWQFLKPVIIANFIAWPVAIYAMQNWLERFPYRFNPIYMIPVCLLSGFIAFIIAWLTAAGITTRDARRNPIHSLRYE
ncbi:MAG: ABC transporter permease [Syntrophaceae bacterium]|nr:ABC transporter permease [Syntrophaceae bacterium]